MYLLDVERSLYYVMVGGNSGTGTEIISLSIMVYLRRNMS